MRSVTIGASRLEFVEGDITRQDTETIVNAANLTLAFPSISTGAYGYPIAEAARIALTTIVDYLKTHPGISLVRVVLFGRPAYEAYETALLELLPAAT